MHIDSSIGPSSAGVGHGRQIAPHGPNRRLDSYIEDPAKPKSYLGPTADFPQKTRLKTWTGGKKRGESAIQPERSLGQAPSTNDAVDMGSALKELSCCASSGSGGKKKSAVRVILMPHLFSRLFHC
jgi:hypothetical protein